MSYLVYHTGPDDLIPCKTWEEAVNTANDINTEYGQWINAPERIYPLVPAWAIPYSQETYEAQWNTTLEDEFWEDRVGCS